MKYRLPASTNRKPDSKPNSARTAEFLEVPYGRTGNGKRLEWFRYQVARTWRKWLVRRSRRRCLNWDRMNDILKRYPLPSVTFVRSWQTFVSEPVR